jgi:hypothetical protein
MNIQLSALSEDVASYAEAAGWAMRAAEGSGFDLSSRYGWPVQLAASSRGARALAEVEQLLDMELAESDHGGILIPWDRFGAVFSDAFALPLRGSSPSPLMLRIDGESQVSRPDFRYRYDYLLGARETQVERVGFFARRLATSVVYCLDENTFRIVKAMDDFNVLPASARKTPKSWLTLATVKSVASEVGATLDAALAANDVVVPSQMALGMCVHSDESLSFYPMCDGLPEKELKEAFFRNVGVEELYTLDGAPGRRVRVVLGERQQAVLHRMKQAQRLRGADRALAMRHPEKLFDGVLDAITIYGERVIGVGDLPGAVMPANPNTGGGFLVQEGPSLGERQEGTEPPKRTKGALPADGDVELPFASPDDLERFRAAAEAARREGRDVVEWDGRTIPITPALLAALEEPVPSETEAGRGSTQGRRFLLVYTNEDDLKEKDIADARFASEVKGSFAPPSPPSSLAAGVELKAHQREAVHWLHRCAALRPHRRGALLADEMGLGKTLEVLTFLAKHVESGGLGAGDDRLGEPGRYRPILIVVPLMLLETRTWQDEMRQFFQNDGEVFLPLLSLHGAGVERARAVGAEGAETVIGRPVLDATRLMEYRVVITNYETVVNYQHSLAQLYDGKRSIWSVVVTDEAQKHKAPDTKVSAALKAISADFKIAMTGTPVENRLLDLWNIVDYFQPALLGTKREFCAEFEEPAAARGAPGALDALRARLLYRAPHSYLLRRTTEAIVRDLPSISIQTIRCEMSDAERAAHQSLLSVLGGERKRGRHLQVLQRLVRLYQHPALDHDQSARNDPDVLLAQSAKLRAVIDLLRDIEKRGEKAIIFARYIDAQQILRLVVGHAFSMTVPIINGATSRAESAITSSAGTERAKRSRKAVLDEFRNAPGFGVLILSPFVAGIGLTIVEANHVIHYGRWWNPAVEAQATARVYRLRQKLPVKVYLPVLVDPKGVISKTFDELLHELMLRKEALAHDFLSPVPQEDECAAELCADLLRDGAKAPIEEEPFDQRQLDALEPSDFEAAVGALLQAEGWRVTLTARSNDGGADVIAIRENVAILVQAKHSSTGHALDDSALSDLLGAADIYRPRLRVSSLRLIVASNAPTAAGTKSAAGSYGIELLCGRTLAERIRASRIGLGAMVACASTRCRSFEDGVESAMASM